MNEAIVHVGLGQFHRKSFETEMNLKRGALVVLTAMGYTNRFASIDFEAVKHKDGTRQFKVFPRGTHAGITFRIDEFREATAEELQYATDHPKERSCQS